eukprot:768596-Hanusia_phi.AAC.6
MQGGRGLMALAMAALVVITMAEEEKKRETSEKSWMETDGMVVGVIVSVVAGGIGGWILLRGGGKKKVRGDAVFLVGACDAGKTVLVQRMREEGGEKGVRSTHTSMMLNECVIQLEGEEKGKGVRVIDYPGHGRLRPMLFDMLEDCAVLIFVIDATTFHLQGLTLILLRGPDQESSQGARRVHAGPADVNIAPQARANNAGCMQQDRCTSGRARGHLPESDGEEETRGGEGVLWERREDIVWEQQEGRRDRSERRKGEKPIQ